MAPIISFVVAVAENGVIGADGGMPWRLSTDLKRFKAVTMGKPMIMGRKTFDSIGRPLPGRANIVVTRDKSWQADGVIIAGSIEEAVGKASRIAADSGADEICVIGGAEIFAALMDRADRLYFTHIEAEVEGDTWFPDFDAGEWQVISSESVPAGENDTAPTRYVVYERLPDRP